MKLMEMSEKMRMVVLLVSSALFFPSASAATWYAKAANYGQSGLDGRSEATAWGTLQEYWGETPMALWFLAKKCVILSNYRVSSK